MVFLTNSLEQLLNFFPSLVLICNIFHIYFHRGLTCSTLLLHRHPSSSLYFTLICLVHGYVSHRIYLSGIKTASVSQTKAKSSFQFMWNFPLSLCSTVICLEPSSHANSLNLLVSESCLGCSAPQQHWIASGHGLYCNTVSPLNLQPLALAEGRAKDADFCWILLSLLCPPPPKLTLKRNLLYNTCLLHDRWKTLKKKEEKKWVSP